MKNRFAFTLIELLVVISIIAILAGIALPVFNKAMESSRATQDASNLKQIGLGVIAYMSDHDDVLPGDSKTSWAVLNDKLGGTNAAAADGTSTPAVVTPSKLYISPFDKNTRANALSYGFNANVVAPAGQDSAKWASATSLIIIAPSPNFAQADLIFAGTTIAPIDITPPTDVTTKRGTHGNRNKINALFGDGHVEGRTWANFVGADPTVHAANWKVEGK